MPKKENYDFRNRRTMLPPDAFAFAPDGPNPAPTDLVDKRTWNSLFSLPDDVSLRTTDHFGSIIKDLHELWGEWLCVTLTIQSLGNSPLSDVCADIGDELYASMFNSICGFYRIGFSCLRNCLEYICVGAELHISGDKVKSQEWLNGDVELKLGFACDNIVKYSNVQSIETYINRTLCDNLFSQKNKTTSGGLVRRVFSELSSYTHGGRGYTSTDLWESNGPIFVSSAFRQWAFMFIVVYVLSLSITKLAEPRLNQLISGSKHTGQSLCSQASSLLPLSHPYTPILTTLSNSIWAQENYVILMPSYTKQYVKID